MRDRKDNTIKVKIYLNGESGRMGQTLCSLIAQNPSFILVKHDADIVIDFSSPEGTLQALSRKKPLVCGTTGLGDTHWIALKKYATQHPVLYAPNFSLGIALLRKMLAAIDEQLPLFKDISIEEIHHTQKKDTPSGTALALGKDLHTTNIQSKRIDDVVGIHTIQCFLEKETLSFTHEAHSREAFAHGALLGAKFLFNKPPGLYTLKDLLSLKIT